MEYGYARVSSKQQNLDRQIKALHEFGLSDRQIITDEESGRSFDRKGYNLLVGTEQTASLLRKGDLLVIYSIDRLGRDYTEIRQQWDKIINVIGADIKVLDMPLLDTRTNSNTLDARFVADLVLQILSYVAEKERATLLRRQRAGYDAMETDEKGRKVSKKTGRHVGNQEISLPENWDTVITDWKAGKITAVEAMKRTGMKKTTFYKLNKGT